MERAKSTVLNQAAPKRLHWTYEEAFSRNLGLIDPDAQQLLRYSCVAIAGAGGVGGIHAVTLARLGIGRFRIADPDRFELANFNRQYGATSETLGCNKADVMAQVVRSINPEAEVVVWQEAIDEDNVAEFLRGADLFVDGVDFYALRVRRLLFREARRQGIWAITAGPVGFGVAWLVFAPGGMSFDAYFDLNDDQDELAQLVAFGIGLAPHPFHLRYMDLTRLDPGRRTAPSCVAACQLCAGVTAVEAFKILTGRGPIWPAPWHQQFDPWVGRHVRRRLRWGNRGPVQRLKRQWLLARIRRQLAA